MILKKIFNACRYDSRLLIILAFVFILFGAFIVEVKMYVSQTQQIKYFNVQIKELQKQKVKQKIMNQRNENGSTVFNFEGLYQRDGVYYAIVNGQVLKPSDRIGGFELLDVQNHSAHFKNLQTGEIISFNLR